MMNREAIYSAVFQFFADLTTGGSPLFATATRKPVTWQEVPAEDQPALLMRQRAEEAEYRKFLPTKWTLHIDLLIYVRTNAAMDHPNQIAGQILNPLLDAVEASLVIDDPVNGTCTLGGLVSYCSIHGQIQTHLGTLGDEAVAIVPIKILVNT